MNKTERVHSLRLEQKEKQQQKKKKKTPSFFSNGAVYSYDLAPYMDELWISAKQTENPKAMESKKWQRWRD